jgi:hypothetical protein
MKFSAYKIGQRFVGLLLEVRNIKQFDLLIDKIANQMPF